MLWGPATIHPRRRNALYLQHRQRIDEGGAVRRQSGGLTKQLVVRIDDRLYEALERDARSNGRTIAQSVRFKLQELASAS